VTSRRLLARGSWPEARYVASALRTETVGGARELAFGMGSERDDHVRLGVLVGSVVSALLAAVVLRRNRHYRRVEAEETREDDADGVPDVYVRPDPAIGS
jgi:hypothetical protein